MLITKLNMFLIYFLVLLQWLEPVSCAVMLMLSSKFHYTGIYNEFQYAHFYMP